MNWGVFGKKSCGKARDGEEGLLEGELQGGNDRREENGMSEGNDVCRRGIQGTYEISNGERRD